MIDKYLTPAQIQALDARREAFGGDAIQAFRDNMAALRAAMDAGDPPSAPAAQAVVERLRNPQRLATIGADPGLAEGLRAMLASEPAVRERLGLDDALFAYLGQAMA